MNQCEPTPTVSELIGRNMRRIREDRGIVLADVARAARDTGLTWDPSAVSRIETGKRDLALEEFLALPVIMTLAIDQPVSMVHLLDGLESMPSTANFGLEIRGLHVLSMLAEPALAARPEISPEEVRDMVSRRLHMDKRRIQVRRADTEERSTQRELQSVADDLGVQVIDLQKAMKELWNEHITSPSDEREVRLISSGADLSQPTRVRTMRGHITRQVMNELREYFEARGETRKEDADGAST